MVDLYFNDNKLKVTTASGIIFTGGIASQGAHTIKRVTRSSNYTAVTDDYVIGFNTTLASGTVTLATALVADGRAVIVKDEGGSASTNFITIATEGAETIDGSTTKQIIGDYGSLTLYSDSTNWFIM